MEYLTDEHYAIAEQNGIPKKNVDHRYYYSNKKWTIQEAITKPLKSPPQFEAEWNEMKDIALTNGITRSQFGNRMRRGKSKEEAAKPKLTEEEKAQLVKQRRGIRNPHLKRAVANGIKPCTYYHRLFLGWSKEQACTEPIGGKKHVSHS